MGVLNEPVAKRIATMFRLLGSNYDGEVLNAVAAMKRLFAAEELTFHDIATVIENANGEIEQLKYSDSDAETIFNRGSRKVALSCGQIPSADYFDEDGEPRWEEMVKFCLSNPAFTSLKPNERISSTSCKPNRWRTPSRPMGDFCCRSSGNCGDPCDETHQWQHAEHYGASAEAQHVR
jgi:hypothetical protein